MDEDKRPPGDGCLPAAAAVVASTCECSCHVSPRALRTRCCVFPPFRLESGVCARREGARSAGLIFRISDTGVGPAPSSNGFNVGRSFWSSGGHVPALRDDTEKLKEMQVMLANPSVDFSVRFTAT